MQVWHLSIDKQKGPVAVEDIPTAEDTKEVIGEALELKSWEEQLDYLTSISLFVTEKIRDAAQNLVKEEKV